MIGSIIGGTIGIAFTGAGILIGRTILSEMNPFKAGVLVAAVGLVVGAVAGYITR